MKKSLVKFYERNAKEGRRARIKIAIDFNHLTPEERKETGILFGSFRVGHGTLTASDAARILRILAGTGDEP